MESVTERATVQRLVTERIVKSAYEETKKRYVPAAGSNRHIHVSAQDLDTLFGKGSALVGQSLDGDLNGFLLLLGQSHEGE